jgi:hypothetical protein
VGTAERKVVRLGETILRFRHYAATRSDVLLLRLHGNEHDASDVGAWASQKYGCDFLDIENDTREVYFELQHQLYVVDPNRIFSREGILRTLGELSAEAPEAAVASVEQLTRFLLRQFRSYAFIIALHNNEAFRLDSYQAGGANQNLAQDVFYSGTGSMHDFVITTRAADFDALQAMHVNTVLEQVADNEAQMGSLSEHCLKQDLRYVNLETKHGHAKVQRTLLGLCLKLVED